MDGAEGSVISADGTRISFITAGSGPAVLLIHGGMGSARRWAALWPLLVEHYEVTAMDRRGRTTSPDTSAYHLEAEYDDVIAVAEQLAARQGAQIDVFGHSYGAVCALVLQRHS